MKIDALASNAIIRLMLVSNESLKFALVFVIIKETIAKEKIPQLVADKSSLKACSQITT